MVNDLAIPLPMIVIAEVLGVPLSDRERFKAWSTDVANSLGGPFQAPDVLDRARRSSNEIADYFRDQIAQRRQAPREDLLSALCAAEEQGDLLSEDELIATCILLLVAGNETTTNLIGNGMLALLNNPDERRRLQADPSLIESAVDEMLRYEGSGADDLAHRGPRLRVPRPARSRRGRWCLLLLAAANRDPAQFPEPERFDVARRPNRHLAFGQGIHYCLGAPLAVAEAQVAFQTLLRRLPEPEAAFETPEWGQSFILRGLKRLPVRSKVVAGP